MKSQVNRIIYWAPRVLSIAFVLFLALFSLDVITPEATPGEIAVGLLMHNVPSLLLAGVVVLAWRWEIIGGVVFLAAGLFYIGMLLAGGTPLSLVLNWGLVIAGPAFLTGGLFLGSWYQKKRVVSKTQAD